MGMRLRELTGTLLAAGTMLWCGSRTDLVFSSRGGLQDASVGADSAVRVDGGVDAAEAAVGPDSAIACDAGVDSPRPVAPLSTATVTSGQPVLRWVLAAGTDGAQVDVCRDRGCTSVVTTFAAPGSSATPPSALGRGLYYWRLRGTRGGSVVTPASPTWQFWVGARSAPVSASWGTVLDVNGDGFADVAVGAWAASHFVGNVFVYLGSPGGLASTPATTLTGPDGPGYFGTSVASAGDVNGDGFADVIVGANGVQNFDETGAAYLYLGGANGLSATPVSTIEGPDGPRVSFGISVAGAGDVNGDGYADVVIGSWRNSGGQQTKAWAQLYFGGECGLSPQAASSVEGPLAHPSNRGIAVASAGDVNGDGYGDVVVGANGTDTVAGGAFLYLGGATGLAASPDAILTRPDGPGATSGSVATAGDVNGDGYADVILGSDNVGSDGHAYVYLGGAGGLSTTPVSMLGGQAGGGGSFGASVASAGDVNGDGYADVVAGGGGAAYVFLGGPAGPASSATATVASADPSGGDFGGSVAGAGDVNGDGLADVVIGAAGENRGAGRAYAYLGAANGLATTPAATLMSADSTAGAFGGAVAAVPSRVPSSPRGTVRRRS